MRRTSGKASGRLSLPNTALSEGNSPDVLSTLPYQHLFVPCSLKCAEEDTLNGSLQSSCKWRRSLNTCLVQPCWGGTSAQKPSQNMRLTVTCARPWKAEKSKKPPTGVVGLLAKGGLIRAKSDHTTLAHW